MYSEEDQYEEELKNVFREYKRVVVEYKENINKANELLLKLKEKVSGKYN